MAGDKSENKTITFGADLLPQRDKEDSAGGFSLGSPEKRWNIYGDIKPIKSKTFSGMYAAADNIANLYKYYGKLKPTSYTAQWHIKMKITINVPTNSNYQGTHIFDITGRQSTYNAYYCWNNIYNTSYRCYYYNTIKFATNEANTTAYGHIFAINLSSAPNRTSASYQRTATIEILEEDNCEFEFFDNILLYADVPGTGNFNDALNFNTADQGLQETGDANNTDRTYFNSNYLINSSSFRLGTYPILGIDKQGRAQGISLYSADYTGNTNSVNTARVYNPNGIDPSLGLYHISTSTNHGIDANINQSLYFIYPALDFRYSDNLVYSYNGSNFAMRTRENVYLRGVIKEDGQFYLRPYEATQIIVYGYYKSSTLFVTASGGTTNISNYTSLNSNFVYQDLTSKKYYTYSSGTYTETTNYSSKPKYQKVWTQDLPTSVEYDADGYQYVYMMVGHPYYSSSYPEGQYQLNLYHINNIYWYNNNQIEQWIPRHDHDDKYATKSHNHDSAYAAKSHTQAASTITGLATVATSGSYNDLSNKPTIPSAVTEATISGWGFTKNTGTSNLVIGTTSTTAAAGNHNHDGVYLKSFTETDPVFSASAAAGITSTDISNWNGKGSSNLTLGETSTTAYRGDRGKTAYDHSQATHAPTDSKTAAYNGTTLSLVTTGEKYTWNNKSNLTIGTTATTAAAGNHDHDGVYLSCEDGGEIENGDIVILPGIEGDCGLCSDIIYESTNRFPMIVGDADGYRYGEYETMWINPNGDYTHVCLPMDPTDDYDITNKGYVDSVSAGVSRIWTGTCNTAAATIAKEVILDSAVDFPSTLSAGIRIAVTFQYSSTTAMPTLTIKKSDGTVLATAKSTAYINYSGSVTAGGATTAYYGKWAPYETVIFTYNGTYWIYSPAVASASGGYYGYYGYTYRGYTTSDTTTATTAIPLLAKTAASNSSTVYSNSNIYIKQGTATANTTDVVLHSPKVAVENIILEEKCSYKRIGNNNIISNPSYVGVSTDRIKNITDIQVSSVGNAGMTWCKVAKKTSEYLGERHYSCVLTPGTSYSTLSSGIYFKLNCTTADGLTYTYVGNYRSSEIGLTESINLNSSTYMCSFDLKFDEEDSDGMVEVTISNIEIYEVEKNGRGLGIDSSNSCITAEDVDTMVLCENIENVQDNNVYPILYESADYIIEEDNDNAWYWRKWKNGDVEMWRKASVTYSTTWSSYGNLYYKADGFEFPQEISFLEAPFVQIQCHCPTGLLFASTHNVQINRFDFYCASSDNPGTTSKTITYNIYVKGRWK